MKVFLVDDEIVVREGIREVFSVGPDSLYPCR